jgi:transcriptional regulator EpsA
VSEFPRLSDIDRERFAEAVEASFPVVSRQQFFAWTQSCVQALVPHDILICGIQDGSRQGMSIHRFSASRYFGQDEFEELTHPTNGLLPLLTTVAEANDATFITSPSDRPSPAADDLQMLVIRCELKNLAAHLIKGTRGTVEAFYGFSRVSAPMDRRLAYSIELLIPHLHNAFLRVLSVERDVSSSNSLRSGRIVTPRQEQILNLIKAGKTNSEIAHLLNCSPWTIKNHIQAILRKLDSNTRTHAIARAMSLGILQPD